MCDAASRRSAHEVGDQHGDDAERERRADDSRQQDEAAALALLNDRRVEIIADRGINVRVDAAFWSTLCRRMEKAFHEGGYESGVLLALNEITQVLTQNFPASEDNLGELPDAPLIV